MARINAAELQAAIAHVNDRMKRAGASYHYRYGTVNGYHTVEAYKDTRNLFRVGSGTPKECIGKLYDDAFDRMGDAYDTLLGEAVREFTGVDRYTCGTCGSTPECRDETCPTCTDINGNDILTIPQLAA
jgi:rubrerythrin